MLKILQGDDTAANNRTITLRLPDEDIGEGFEIGFLFMGIDKTGPYTPGGTLKFDYTREQTACFPLGIHYAKTYLKKDNLMQTISNSIQVKVTDSADELTDKSSPSGGGNGMTLGVTVNTGVPHVDMEELVKSSSVAEIKELANALLRAINKGADPDPQ